MAQRKRSDKTPISSILSWPSALLLAILLTAGCVTTVPTHAVLSVNRSASTEIVAGESIALVLDNFSGEFSRSKENEFVGCISDALRTAEPTVRIVTPDDFRRAAVPDLARRESPSRPWEQLMVEPELRARAGAVGIRYVIFVSGDTQQKGKDFTDWIAAGTEYYRVSWLKAVVWDIGNAQRAGDMTVTVSGRPGYVILLPLVGVGVAYTETRACNEISKALKTFLAGESLPSMILASETEAKTEDSSRKLYRVIHPLTYSLFKEIELGKYSSITDSVRRYVEEVHKHAAKLGHTLTSADEEMFQMELRLAKEADEGTTKDKALGKLHIVTTRYLIDLYFGRSATLPSIISSGNRK